MALGCASTIRLYIDVGDFCPAVPPLERFHFSRRVCMECVPPSSAHNVEGAERSPVECCSGVHVSAGMLGAATHTIKQSSGSSEISSLQSLHRIVMLHTWLRQEQLNSLSGYGRECERIVAVVTISIKCHLIYRP
jgi:hypothetical protein